MANLKINYDQIAQVTNYFVSLESIQQLTFLQRRRLKLLNEKLRKELDFLQEEVGKIAEEFCEKDEEGNFVLENGERKIKKDLISECSTRLNEVYLTETEIEYLDFKLPENYFDDLSCSEATCKLIEENFIPVK